MFWIIIGVFVIPLIHTISSMNKRKRDRNRQLELIQRKLAEKLKLKVKLKSILKIKFQAHSKTYNDRLRLGPQNSALPSTWCY